MQEFEYVESPEAQMALARFGELRTPAMQVEMPTMSPGVRTQYDAAALMANLRRGMDLPVISPYLSNRGYLSGLSSLLGVTPPRLVEVYDLPLVIPDLESEALSFNCNARANFRKVSRLEGTSISRAVDELMMSGLSADATKGRKSSYQAWKDVARRFGFTTLTQFLRAHLRAIGSDVFLAPTVILRSDPRKLTRTLGWAYEILDEELTQPQFKIHGIHLLIHSEVFADDPAARETRREFFAKLDTWTGNESLENLILSFKVHDGQRNLTSLDAGSTYRRNLSEFVTEVGERVRRAKGALVAHNFGLWSLGMLDSGADTASFRMSGGSLKIDVPISHPGRGYRKPPGLWSWTTLVEEPKEDWQRQYQKNREFPTPPHVEVVPYWMEKYTDQLVYAARVRTDLLLELAKEYRQAGLDPSIPLGEALRSRIMDSEARQELVDLSPSLG